MTITEFLLARIAEDEELARDLLTDLEGEVHEDWAGQSDERGPMTPYRLLSSQMWAQYAGQSKRRSFARGQQIARLASPARVLAECAAKRVLVELAGLIHDKITWEWGGCESWKEDGWAEDNEGTELIRTLAAVYADHKDYHPDWTTT